MTVVVYIVLVAALFYQYGKNRQLKQLLDEYMNK